VWVVRVLKTDLVGQTLSLLLTATTETGDPDFAVFPGDVVLENETLYLDRGDRGPRVEIRDDWVPRIQLASPAASAILQGSKYVLRLTVGRTDGEPGGTPFLDTGLDWPP